MRAPIVPIVSIIVTVYRGFRDGAMWWEGKKQ